MCMMQIRKILSAILMAGGLFVLVSGAAQAQEDIPERVNVVKTITATSYLNGGIGKDEESTMRRMAKKFPLRITFAERKDGEFVTGVPVVISDASGKPVLELPRSGPMLFVMLPDGKYKVNSRFKGVTKSQEVTLSGKPGKDLYFLWNGVSEK